MYFIFNYSPITCKIVLQNSTYKIRDSTKRYSKKTPWFPFSSCSKCSFVMFSFFPSGKKNCFEETVPNPGLNFWKTSYSTTTKAYSPNQLQVSLQLQESDVFVSKCSCIKYIFTTLMRIFPWTQVFKFLLDQAWISIHTAYHMWFLFLWIFTEDSHPNCLYSRNWFLVTNIEIFEY